LAVGIFVDRTPGIVADQVKAQSLFERVLDRYVLPRNVRYAMPSRQLNKAVKVVFEAAARNKKDVRESYL
jgi:hypothetical protein